MSEEYINKLKEELEELKSLIEKDDTLESIKDLIYVLAAPGFINYRTHLFCYKDELLVILTDEGNGHYSYTGCLHEMIDNI